jgi:hypothetical protein
MGQDRYIFLSRFLEDSGPCRVMPWRSKIGRPGPESPCSVLISVSRLPAISLSTTATAAETTTTTTAARPLHWFGFIDG